MEVGPSEVPEQEFTPIKKLEMTDVLEDIKNLIEKHDNPAIELQKYLVNVESKIIDENKQKLDCVNQDQVRLLIEKHPYFKNPSTYHIRLITIMKYLKKKGIDITLNDFDLLVDEIILSIGDVEKISYGKYSRKRF
jgi:DNA invertase Pin-like site-specific DNA recombinase